MWTPVCRSQYTTTLKLYYRGEGGVNERERERGGRGNEDGGG